MHYAEVLLGRDVLRTTEFYAVPALILISDNSVHLTERKQTEEIFAAPWGSAKGSKT